MKTLLMIFAVSGVLSFGFSALADMVEDSGHAESDYTTLTPPARFTPPVVAAALSQQGVGSSAEGRNVSSIAKNGNPIPPTLPSQASAEAHQAQILANKRKSFQHKPQ